MLSPLSATLAMLALAVSTLLAYAGTLVALAPSAARGPLFALGLLFPLIWQFLADAGDLNRGSGREERVLATAGLGVAALAIVTVAFASGFIGTETEQVGDLARALFAPPLAAVLVTALAAVFESDAATSPTPNGLLPPNGSARA